ncbi:hypothetical protein [Raineyella fluvialis]|uniref:Uncharacterized protein n=1 Tax=Raineyella fluvialis TaxID=2662261 RepID=A0A5Q2FEC0_9ACTN|nr:hypothetical protein [Raineyella fluvialis]QGF22606.1 hypothetical protein Rai3103_01715 [Raineyella fluvialis]
MKGAGESRGTWGVRDDWRPLSERWATYAAWNQAIADVMFPELDEPAPVYLDFEDDRMEALASAAGVAPGEVEAELAAAVLGVLDLTEGPAAVLRTIRSRTRNWYGQGDWQNPPPMLAFLSVLCMAAEKMAGSDEYAANNFYGRLTSLLGLPAKSTKLEQGYRGDGSYLWNMLKAWLLHCDGRRGLPTVEASTPRFVGYPITQAMMRAGDRERLIDFFESAGLPPGSNIPPQHLEGLFDSWIGQNPSPASKNLQRLWQNPGSGRQRVLDAAAAALGTWNGQTARATDEHGAGGRLRLSLALSSFPKKRLGVGVLAFLPDATNGRDATLVAAQGEVPVSLSPSIPGALTLGESSAVSAQSLLEADLVIRDAHSARTLTRHPRRLVLFRQDEMTARWTETEHALLTEDLRLLCFDELLPSVRRVLDEAARPAWHEQPDVPGLPDSWTLITDVQLFDIPRSVAQSGVNDLQGLVPVTTSHLTLAGGFPLPGATRGSWHVGEPPEIRAVSDAQGGFAVRLEDITGDLGLEDDSELRTIDSWGDDGNGVLIVDLASAELEPGDYRISMWPAGSKEPESTYRIRLASGDQPDLRQWAVSDPVELDPTRGLGVMGVDHVAPECNVRIHPASDALRSGPLPASPSWSEKHSGAVSREPIRLTAVNPDSCLYTGKHRVTVDYVPQDAKGRPLVAWTTGRCVGCGLTRRYSTSYWSNRARYARAKEAAERPRHDLRQLPVPDAPTDLCWDLALDGLFYTGGGSWSHFERVARHIQSSGLVVDQFARFLEALGHVNIRRDSRSLRPVAWEICPSTLVRTARGYFLSGYWPDSLTNSQADVAGTRAVLAQEANPEGPESWFLRGVPENVLDEVVVLEDGWSHLALQLPPISAVVAELPRQTLGLEGQLRWFDPRESRWLSAGDAGGRGAYRVSRFTTIDFLRTEEDVRNDTVALSTVQLSKHAAPLVTGNRPLLAYDRTSAELSVPLGAELPGLYGRAVVMASGLLPYRRGRSMVYRDVQVDLAEHLAYLFTH